MYCASRGATSAQHGVADMTCDEIIGNDVSQLQGAYAGNRLAGNY